MVVRGKCHGVGRCIVPSWVPAQWLQRWPSAPAEPRSVVRYAASSQTTARSVAPRIPIPAACQAYRMIPQGHTTMAYAGTVIALASLLALLTVLSSALTSRPGIPVRSIYHGVGMLAGENGGSRSATMTSTWAYLIGSADFAGVLPARGADAHPPAPVNHSACTNGESSAFQCHVDSQHPSPAESLPHAGS